MEKADKEIRDRVTSGGYTEEEAKALARAKNNQAEADKVVAARNKRLVDAYRVEVIELPRADSRAARRVRQEDGRVRASSASRSTAATRPTAPAAPITDATLRATQQLEAIEGAVLNVRADRLRPRRGEPAALLQRDHPDHRSAVRTPTETTSETDGRDGRTLTVRGSAAQGAVLHPARAHEKRRRSRRTSRTARSASRPPPPSRRARNTEPKPIPTSAAVAVARSRSPRRRQSSARSTRPPSIG